MAGMIGVVKERAQLSAIADLRWRLFINSLRSKSGRIELGSRVFAGSIYVVGALGAAVGLGAAAYSFIANDKAALLAALLWPVFISWQVLPVMISSFSDNIDVSGLLRFPLTYRAYVLVRLLYGLMDVGTILGIFCLTGILIGIAAAKLSLLLPSLLILLIFAALNILLSRMVFAWIERWLAQRRTRELMAGMFFVLLLGTQLIAPAMRYYSGTTETQPSRGAVRRLFRTDVSGRQIVQKIAPLQRTLPPGLAGAAIEEVASHSYSGALGYSVSLLLYTAAIAALLGIRLRAQYRGENLSEAGVQTAGTIRTRIKTSVSTPRTLASAHPVQTHPAQKGSAIGPIGAVFVKEILYIMRSGPLLLTLLTPTFMLLVLSSQWHGSNVYRFPIGVAYTLLVVANLLYNTFGTDGTGVQLYLTAPVRMRTVILAKNLTNTSILALQVVLTFAVTSLVFAAPSLQIVGVTLAWILFSLPINLAVGNLLSLQSPRKMNFEKFGRQQTSTLNALTGLGVQIATVGSGALVLFFMRHQPSLWPATAIFSTLAVATFGIYLVMLNGVDRIALDRRETLITALCKS